MLFVAVQVYSVVASYFSMVELLTLSDSASPTR
jgi:hypothetical protein